MVVILSVAFTALTGIEHERTSWSLMCTEHAPHCATPQPYLVPVRPACSRIAHSNGVSGSTCTSRVLPLILSFATGVSSGMAYAPILFLLHAKVNERRDPSADQPHAHRVGVPAELEGGGARQLLGRDVADPGREHASDP